jgi:hypothetical protein
VTERIIKVDRDKEMDSREVGETQKEKRQRERLRHIVTDRLIEGDRDGEMDFHEDGETEKE